MTTTRNIGARSLPVRSIIRTDIMSATLETLKCRFETYFIAVNVKTLTDEIFYFMKPVRQHKIFLETFDNDEKTQSIYRTNIFQLCMCMKTQISWNQWRKPFVSHFVQLTLIRKNDVKNWAEIYLRNGTSPVHFCSDNARGECWKKRALTRFLRPTFLECNIIYHTIHAQDDFPISFTVKYIAL